MEQFIETIGDALAQHGFKPHRHPGLADLGVVAFWRRCTWNTNRVVAIIRRSEGDFAPRPFCQQIKWKLLRHTWFIPFLYEVGLQVIIVGKELEGTLDDPDRLRGVVDAVSNQFVVLQSVFVLDESSKRYAGVRTWGQFVTGQFQDAIAKAIEAAGFKSADA